MDLEESVCERQLCTAEILGWVRGESNARECFHKSVFKVHISKGFYSPTEINRANKMKLS